MTMSDQALDEAVVALGWIVDNANVSRDFPNSNLRLRQIMSRAEEALHDIDLLRKEDRPVPPGDELWQAIAVGYCEWTNGEWPDDDDLAEARAPAKHIAGYVRSWIARAAHNLHKSGIESAPLPSDDDLPIMRASGTVGFRWGPGAGA